MATTKKNIKEETKKATQAVKESATKAATEAKKASKEVAAKAEKAATEAKKASKEVAAKAEKAATEAKKARKEVAAKAEKVATEAKKSAKETATKAEKVAKETKKTAKKTATKLATKELYFEFADKQYEVSTINEMVEKAYVAAGHKASAIKSIRLYVKAEDSAVYYVINEKEQGRIDL